MERCSRNLYNELNLEREVLEAKSYEEYFEAKY